MIVTLIKRATHESDGPGFQKTKNVFYIKEKPALVICESAFEYLVGVAGLQVGDEAKVRVELVESPSGLDQYSVQELATALLDRIDKVRG